MPKTKRTKSTSSRKAKGVPASVKKAITKKKPPHVVVKARAGTGKTFTLVIGLAYMVGGKVWQRAIDVLGFEPVPSPQQQQVWDALREGETPSTVIYLAFNKSIVQEFEHKYDWLVSALSTAGVELKFQTVHSLGNGACFRGHGRKKLCKWRTWNLLEDVMDCDLREVRKDNSGRELVRSVNELVGKCKLTLAGWDGTTLSEPTDDELDALCNRFSVEINGDRDRVYGLAREVLIKSQKHITEMDFDDMIWLPTVNDYHVTKYDLVLGDEAQDWNAAQQQIILGAGRRYFVVGDIFQAVYGFAGADTQSIDTMTSHLSSLGEVVEYPLTVTRRCGKRIVQDAQQLVPDFEAHETNADGEVGELPYADAFQQYADGDMVLCRTNAPLVGLAFRLIRDGRKANIKGRDIGQGIINTIERLNPESVGDLMSKVDEWYQVEAKKIASRKYSSEEALIALEDRRECVVAFCHGANTIDGVKKTIRDLFDDNDREGVLLSSVHRSKGLEAERVFVLNPHQLPHPMAKTNEAVEQEHHLKYVAITRAISRLTWVLGGPKENGEVDV